MIKKSYIINYVDKKFNNGNLIGESVVAIK